MKLHEAMEEVLSSHTLAVIPLAILMAMSPLNSSAQEKKLVRSQDFDFGKGFYEENDSLRIEYYDLNGNNADIENVRAESNETETKMAVEGGVFGDGFNFHDIYGNIKSINKCNYNVVGDDGVSVGIWTVPYVTLDGLKGSGQYLMRLDIVEAIEKFANSKENNGAVEIRNIDRNLKIGYSTISTIGDVHKFKVPSYFLLDLGKKLKDYNLQTAIGDYKLTLYSNDGNDGDYEYVFVERSDGFYGIVERIRELDIQIVSPDYYYEERAKLACVIDLKCTNKDKYTILDPELYSILLQLKEKNPEIGKAYETTTEEYPVTLTPIGTMPKY